MKKTMILTAALTLALSVAGCGANTDEKGTAGGAGQSSTRGTTPPMVPVEDLAGTVVEVSAERPLVVTADDPTAWTGQTTDTTIARFVPGIKTDSYEQNFGFEGLTPGTTDASVTDGAQTIKFTITVK